MTAFSDTAYVAWGIDEETTGLPTYWIAVWDEDGPQSPETIHYGRVDALKSARTLAKQTGLGMVEVDEFGAVRNPA